MFLFARLSVGGAFLVAGKAKSGTGGRAVFRQGLVGFGLTVRLIGPLVVTVPFLESVLGALLLVGLATHVAAIAALGLLGLFSGVIAAALLRHQRVDCGCFGSRKARPVGPGSLARNAALAGL